MDLNGLNGFQKEMGDGLNQLATTTGANIEDVVRTMRAISEGDLTKTIDKDYQGAYGEMKEYANNTVLKLSMIISEVDSATDSLLSASEQVSTTAQSLSQAATEQAAGVEQTSAAIEQMTASIAQKTENAKVTDAMASKASSEASEGGESVKATVTAMKQIAQKITIIEVMANEERQTIGIVVDGSTKCWIFRRRTSSRRRRSAVASAPTSSAAWARCTTSSSSCWT